MAIIPVNRESATAISGPVIVGSDETIRVTVWPTSNDMTAILKEKEKNMISLFVHSFLKKRNIYL